MPTRDLTPPSPIAVIDGDDAMRVEQWAARQRADLSRLRLTLRSAQMRAAHAGCAGPSAGIAGPELLAVFDSMLDEAVRTAAVAVEAARREAAAIVAAERTRAADHLRSLGIDPLVALGPDDWTSAAVPPPAPAASAHELWHDTEVAFLATAPALILVDPSGALEPMTVVPAPAAERRSIDDLEIDDLEMATAFPSGRPDPARVAGRPTVETDPTTGHFPVLPPLAAVAGILDDAALARLFEDFWEREEGEHQRHETSAGLGRPPPHESGAPTAIGVVGAEFDDLDPVRAFPSRWPDAAEAAWAFHGPVDLRTKHAPMPRYADDAERFDDFWAGRESDDVFWDGAETKRPLRDRLRRRATQEQG